MMRYYPGYHGAFTREQAPGAIANGARIVKARMEEGDSTPLGTLGTVLGSMVHPDPAYYGAIAYFIEWDDKPKIAVGVIEWKVKAAP